MNLKDDSRNIDEITKTSLNNEQNNKNEIKSKGHSNSKQKRTNALKTKDKYKKKEIEFNEPDNKEINKLDKQVMSFLYQSLNNEDNNQKSYDLLNLYDNDSKILLLEERLKFNERDLNNERVEKDNNDINKELITSNHILEDKNGKKIIIDRLEEIIEEKEDLSEMFSPSEKKQCNVAPNSPVPIIDNVDNQSYNKEQMNADILNLVNKVEKLANIIEEQNKQKESFLNSNSKIIEEQIIKEEVIDELYAEELSDETEHEHIIKEETEEKIINDKQDNGIHEKQNKENQKDKISEDKSGNKKNDTKTTKTKGNNKKVDMKIIVKDKQKEEMKLNQKFKQKDETKSNIKDKQKDNKNEHKEENKYKQNVENDERKLFVHNKQQDKSEKIQINNKSFKKDKKDQNFPKTQVKETKSQNKNNFKTISIFDYNKTEQTKILIKSEKTKEKQDKFRLKEGNLFSQKLPSKNNNKKQLSNGGPKKNILNRTKEATFSNSLQEINLSNTNDKNIFPDQSQCIDETQDIKLSVPISPYPEKKRNQTTFSKLKSCSPEPHYYTYKHFDRKTTSPNQKNKTNYQNEFHEHICNNSQPKNTKNFVIQMFNNNNNQKPKRKSNIINNRMMLTELNSNFYERQLSFEKKVKEKKQKLREDLKNKEKYEIETTPNPNKTEKLKPRKTYEIDDTNCKILRLQQEQFLTEQKALKNLNKKFGRGDKDIYISKNKIRCFEHIHMPIAYSSKKEQSPNSHRVSILETNKLNHQTKTEKIIQYFTPSNPNSCKNNYMKNTKLLKKPQTFNKKLNLTVEQNKLGNINEAKEIRYFLTTKAHSQSKRDHKRNTSEEVNDN